MRGVRFALVLALLFCAGYLGNHYLDLAKAATTTYGPPGIKGGKFEVTCSFSNLNQVDPIVSPGQQMSAHLHTFFGNKGVNENSTPDSLRGGPTTCKVADDTAAYWVPALYRRTTGALVQPVKIFAYYFGLPGRTTEAPPAGLEMVAGNAHATSVQGKSVISWSCGNGGHSHSPVRDQPYSCKQAGIVSQGVVAIIKFPWCWDGVGLGTADVVYGDSKTGECPAEYPHILPQVQEHVHYGSSVSKPGFQRGDLVELASDRTMGETGGITMHADWANAWNQDRLDQINADCTAIRKDCGFLVDPKATFKQVLGATTQYTQNRQTRMAFRGLLAAARARHGLNKVGGSRTLHRAAHIKTRWIIESGQFSHTPSGHSLADSFQKAGYGGGCRTITVGEALARGYHSAKSAFDALMASPEHRQILLGHYRSVGISYRPTYGLWAISFGRCA